jgi:aryl-alcohol dehydrogenase-like predicted oxidoreductase
MEKRKLGQSGISVSPLAFGGNVFGWTADEATSFNLLDTFVDAGFNLIDTADVYCRWVTGNGGESETIIGKWLRKSNKRQKVVIATKVGHTMGMGANAEKGLAKEYIFRAIDASLKRLQTDYIDLYQSHQDDESTPIEETLEAYDTLVKQGKIRAIGASNFSAKRLAESLKVSEKHNYPAYQTLQPLYNLYDREGYEKQLATLCVDKSISVINYYSLAAGFLTGKYRADADFSKSPRGNRVKTTYFNERGLNILKALDEVGKQYSATPAQVSLAWLLSRPAIAAPIASATSVPQLKELIKGIELKLDSVVIDKLNKASAF